MGFDATLATLPPSDDALAQLETLTREHAAVAAIRVVADADGAEVLLFDRATDKLLQRHVVGQADQVARLALRAVELLRASLLELALPDAPRGDVEASAALLETARVPPRASPAGPVAVPEAAPPLAGVDVG